MLARRTSLGSVLFSSFPVRGSEKIESFGEATVELWPRCGKVTDLNLKEGLILSFCRGIPGGDGEFVPARSDEGLSLSTFETSLGIVWDLVRRTGEYMLRVVESSYLSL
jgi:hypothetical protein